MPVDDDYKQASSRCRRSAGTSDRAIRTGICVPERCMGTERRLSKAYTHGIVTLIVRLARVTVEALLTLIWISSPCVTAVVQAEIARFSFFWADDNVGLSVLAMLAVVGNPAYVLLSTSITHDPL